jgi:transposase-like protein
MSPQEMLERYERGGSLHEIGREAHLSHESVRAYIVNAGGTIRKRGEMTRRRNTRQVPKEKLRKSYEASGKNISQLARDLGVGKTTVRRWLIEAGIHQGKTGKETNRHVVPCSALLEAYPNLLDEDDVETLSLRAGVSWRTIDQVRRGEGVLGYETADRIVRAFGHPLNWYRAPLAEHYWPGEVPESAINAQKWLASCGAA